MEPLANSHVYIDKNQCTPPSEDRETLVRHSPLTMQSPPQNHPAGRQSSHASLSAEALLQDSAKSQIASSALDLIEHAHSTDSGRPFKHLHQRSYDQIMKILMQTGSAPFDIAVLSAHLDKEINGLQTHRNLVNQRLNDNTQSHKKIASGDILYARHTIARYNSENPALNAEVFDSPPDLIRHITKHIRQFGRLRALLRMGSAANTLHHASVDIRNKDGKLTILFVDPANLAHQSIASAAMSINDALSGLSEYDPKTGYVAVGAQNSPDDCIQFSESYLKKMADEEGFFDELHEKLSNDELLNEEEYIRPRNRDALMAMEIAEELIKDDLENITQAVPDARHFFPLSFFKHSHSQKDIEALFERREREKEVKVNKNFEHRPAQTLSQRVAANIPDDGRIHGGSVRRYSISIEKKRLNEIDKTIAFFTQLQESLSPRLPPNE